MFQMMKADLYRVFKGKAIYITFAIIIVTAFVSAIGMTPGHIGLASSNNTIINISDTEFLEKLSKAKSLKDVRKIMKSEGPYALDKAVIGNNVNLYYAFIVIIVIVLCIDFSAKTIKNTLSSAVSRKKYYLSKLFLCMLLCTVLVLFNNYFFYFLNLCINGALFSSSFISITELTLIQLPLIYGIISLLLCFAFLFQKTSSFNTVSIPFIMVIQLIVLGVTSLFKIKADWFYHYEFGYALEKLAITKSGNYIFTCILLGIAYILIFNIVGYCKFCKTEIK